MSEQQMTPEAALVRLRQYGERTSTWSTATYDSGTERTLHQIAQTLADENARLNARVAELQSEGHLTVADVVAWLVKKSGEYGVSNRENRAKAEAVGRVADKISRGAIRPTEGVAPGTRQCGHDDYHTGHEWADQPHIWCPGHSYDADEAVSSS